MILQSSKIIRGLPLIFSSSVIQIPKIQGKNVIFRERGGGVGRGLLLTANSEKNRIWAYSWGSGRLLLKETLLNNFHRTNILKPNSPKQRPYSPPPPSFSRNNNLELLLFNKIDGIFCVYSRLKSSNNLIDLRKNW